MEYSNGEIQDMGSADDILDSVLELFLPSLDFLNKRSIAAML